MQISETHLTTTATATATTTKKKENKSEMIPIAVGLGSVSLFNALKMKAGAYQPASAIIEPGALTANKQDAQADQFFN